MEPKPIARLFEAPLEEFVSARNALARELRSAGKDEEAKSIAAVRRPARALWLVNQLGRRAAKEVAALIDSTRRVREAQRKSLSGDQLREAMRDQREALNALAAAAGDAALDRRVRDTLQAAAMSEPDALREGRVEQELAPSGFDALFAGGVEPAPRAPHPRGKAAAKPAPDKKRERRMAAADQEAHELAAHADELENVKAAARSAATRAAEVAAAAQAEARKAHAAAERAQAEAEKASEKARVARDRAAEARSHAHQLRSE